MSLVKAYDGSAWRQVRALSVYDGTTWRKVKRVQVYDGTAWRDATPAWFDTVTGVADSSTTWHVTLTWVTSALGSYRWRFKVEAGAFGAWTTVNAPSSPSSAPSGTGASGNLITVQIEPYTGASLGGDAGPVETALITLP